MAKLIYLTNVSLDGYIEDRDGVFDLFEHDADVFGFTTELVRSVGSIVYGRRLYELMAVWETDPDLAAQSDLFAAFSAAWRATSKVVFSTTLTDVSTADTRLERRFDPALVRELKDAVSRDLLIGGADIASQALEARLVDEYQLFVWPSLIGGGKPALSHDARHDLELLDERRFDNGVVHLRYRVLT